MSLICIKHSSGFLAHSTVKASIFKMAHKAFYDLTAALPPSSSADLFLALICSLL